MTCEMFIVGGSVAAEVVVSAEEKPGASSVTKGRPALRLSW